MRMTARRFALFSTTRLGGSAGGGGGLTTAAPTKGAHRYWRINISSSTGSASSLLELEFWRDGSTKHATATPIASATGAGGSLAAAFDGVIDAGFWWSGGTTGYIGMDFGAGNAKEVGIVSIVGRSGSGQAPNTFTVDYSDDGSAWTTAWTVTGVGADLSTQTKKRFYMEPAAGFKAWRARFVSDASGAVRITAAEFRRTAAGLDGSSAAWFKQTSSDVVGTVADIFDGSQATAWAATAFPAWVAVYFPDNRTIAQIALTTVTNADQTQAPDNVAIDWTNDGFTWTQVFTQSGLSWTTGETKTFTV